MSASCTTSTRAVLIKVPPLGIFDSRSCRKTTGKHGQPSKVCLAYHRILGCSQVIILHNTSLPLTSIGTYWRIHKWFTKTGQPHAVAACCSVYMSKIMKIKYIITYIYRKCTASSTHRKQVSCLPPRLVDGGLCLIRQRNMEGNILMFKKTGHCCHWLCAHLLHTQLWHHLIHLICKHSSWMIMWYPVYWYYVIFHTFHCFTLCEWISNRKPTLTVPTLILSAGM